MYQAVLHTHSGLRWIALILILVAIFNAFTSKGRNTYEKKDKMINLFSMVILHIQVLIGTLLAFVTEKEFYTEGWMKSSMNRFFGMEHILMMVAAAVIFTIGRKKAEAQTEPAAKHGKIALWYTIGLLLILAAIPWPFRGFGNGWF
jgi:uncharacterized membrane protein